MHIDIVADIVCPWCFIGKRRLERALALRPDIVATRSWRAFQLNPDMPAEGMPRELYLAAKFGNPRQAGAAMPRSPLPGAARGSNSLLSASGGRRTPSAPIG